MQKLGTVQKYVLRYSLGDTRRTGGSWTPGCGWYYENTSRTIRIMESLAKRKLVDIVTREDKNGRSVCTYTLNDAGRAAIREDCRV